MKNRLFMTAACLLASLSCDKPDPASPASRPDVAGVWSATLAPGNIKLLNPDTTIVLAEDTTKLKITLKAADSSFEYVSQVRMSGTYIDAFTATGTWSVPEGDTLVVFAVESASTIAGPIPAAVITACGNEVQLKLRSSTRLTTSLALTRNLYCMMGKGDLVELIESDAVAGPVIMGIEQAFTRVP